MNYFNSIAPFKVLFIMFCYCILFVDIPWPEHEEALSDNSRCVIDKLLNFDPSSRPSAAGNLHLLFICYE